MINIMKYKWLYFGISLMFLLPGVISLLLFQVRPSIDFTGGSLIELKSQVLKTDKDLIKNQLKDEYQISAIQDSDVDQFIIRGQVIDNQHKDLIIAKLKQTDPDTQELRFETVGPTLGKELMAKTLTAVVIVSTFITLYVGWRFNELKYGVSAVLAMFHDTLILLGSFSLLGHFWGVEVDVLFVTALLTTLSFSVHDTIVVFDRIREKRKKVSSVKYVDILNAAVLETLGRSINNSTTIIVMLLALAILGGASIKWFAIALLIGAVTGTYSSTFTAVPLLLLWDSAKKFLKSRKK